ncbi:MAG TPA: hypothetical protein VFI31_20535 [Pirellulales bacterium]|nr:hypothetical protein [Pirellulales bacterium]
MRLTLAIGAATLLAFAGVAVVLHERAVAQQAAAAQREAAEAAAQPANRTSSPSAAEPSTTPPATDGNPVAFDPYADRAPTPPGNAVAGYPPATYNSVQAPYGAVQGGWGPPAADPELAELTSQDQQLEVEVQTLARQLADSDDDKQRAELKPRLAAALEKQFDAQQKLREMEISRIEARVQKLRDLVRKRTDSRRKIIDNRYEQLLNDAEGLGWNSTASNGVQYAPLGLPQSPGRLPGMRPITMPPAAAPAVPAPRRQ